MVYYVYDGRRGRCRPQATGQGGRRVGAVHAWKRTSKQMIFDYPGLTMERERERVRS